MRKIIEIWNCGACLKNWWHNRRPSWRPSCWIFGLKCNLIFSSLWRSKWFCSWLAYSVNKNCKKGQKGLKLLIPKSFWFVWLVLAVDKKCTRCNFLAHFNRRLLLGCSWARFVRYKTFNAISSIALIENVTKYLTFIFNIKRVTLLNGRITHDDDYFEAEMTFELRYRKLMRIILVMLMTIFVPSIVVFVSLQILPF